MASSIPHARMKPLQIGGLFYQRQFRYCSGYDARRVQTIYQISTWNVFLLILENIFFMKKMSDFRKFVETGVDPRQR